MLRQRGDRSHRRFRTIVTPRGCYWVDPDGVKVGYDYLQGSITLFNRFTWHNYFCSWRAYDHCVSRYFPQWLKDKIYGGGMFSRITECGWHPLVDDPQNPGQKIPREHRDQDDPAGDYYQYQCDDRTPDPNGPVLPDHKYPEGTYAEDLKWFITKGYNGTNTPPAGGVAVWLLAGDHPDFARHVAVDATGAQRPWYQAFKTWQP